MSSSTKLTPYDIFGITALFTASYVLTIGLAYAASARPAACTTDGELSEAPPVVSRHGSFQRNATRYPYRIFGLGALDPDYTISPYRKCLRYEILNESARDIQYLRWPDAGANFHTISGNQRELFPADQLTAYDETHYEQPVVGQTLLRAFEGAPSVSETVLTHEQYVLRHGSAPNPPQAVFWFDVTTDAPHLARLIEEVGMSHEAVQAVSRPEMSREYPKLRSGVISEDMEFSIETSAAYLEQQSFVTISSTIRANVPHEPEIAIYAPVLSAMEMYEKEWGEEWPMEVKLGGFLSMVEDRRYERLDLDGSVYGRILAFPTEKELDWPALFVVKHPVTIVLPQRSVCIDARTYSPVPLSISDAYCYDQPAQ
jgi:hypothetical protein